MSIYNPLQFNNRSFSSRMLQTIDEQAAKKQESIDKMNETLRTEAAQGRLGKLANGVLEQALADASEQGLIGVNQYEIMNKAMPQFYKLKSSVTELNNAYNAELEAAKADDRIRVDANYLGYLNEKYYGDGEIDPSEISAHTANAVSSKFSLHKHTDLLDMDVIGKSVVDSIGDFSITSKQQADGKQYFMQTESGKKAITPAGAEQMMQDEGTLALLGYITGEDPKMLSAETAAQVLNNYVQTRSDSTKTRTGDQLSPEEQMRQSYQNSLKLQQSSAYLSNKYNKAQDVAMADITNLAQEMAEANNGTLEQNYKAAYDQLIDDESGLTPNQKMEVKAAYSQLMGAKKVSSLDEKGQMRVDQLFDSLLEDPKKLLSLSLANDKSIEKSNYLKGSEILAMTKKDGLENDIPKYDFSEGEIDPNKTYFFLSYVDKDAKGSTYQPIIREVGASGKLTAPQAEEVALILNSVVDPESVVGGTKSKNLQTNNTSQPTTQSTSPNNLEGEGEVFMKGLTPPAGN